MVVMAKHINQGDLFGYRVGVHMPTSARNGIKSQPDRSQSIHSSDEAG
jgi:hypothetical protein